MLLCQKSISLDRNIQFSTVLHTSGVLNHQRSWCHATAGERRTHFHLCLDTWQCDKPAAYLSNCLVSEQWDGWRGIRYETWGIGQWHSPLNIPLRLSSRSLLMVQIFKSCSLKLSALFQHSLGFLSKHTSSERRCRDENTLSCLSNSTWTSRACDVTPSWSWHVSGYHLGF